MQNFESAVIPHFITLHAFPFRGRGNSDSEKGAVLFEEAAEDGAVGASFFPGSFPPPPKVGITSPPLDPPSLPSPACGAASLRVTRLPPLCCEHGTGGWLPASSDDGELGPES